MPPLPTLNAEQFDPVAASCGGLEVVEGIPAGWDGLTAGAPVTLSSRWIELAAARIPGGYRTFLTSHGDEVSVAFGGGVLSQPTGHPRFDPYEVLSGRAVSAGIAQAGPHPWQGLDPSEVFPCCLLMFPNYETAPAGAGRQDPAALRAFLRSLAEWCQSEGIRSIAALFLRPEPAAVHEALEQAGFGLVPMIDRAELAVTWADFDGYLAALPKKRRAVVRGELRALTARDVQIIERPLRADEPELARLRSNLIEKYGGPPDVERESRGLDTLRRCFSEDDLRVFEAVRDGKSLSFGLFVRDGSHWTGLMTGSDYSHPDSALTYFATFFYQPAAVAPEYGIDRISYGIGSLEAKRLRGCTLRTLYAAHRVLRPRSPDV